MLNVKGMRACLLGTLAVLAALCPFAYQSLRGSGLLEVHFLDVGQGDAIYIRSPSGSDMLIDGGPSVAALRALAGAMPWYDRSIDVVVATHPDADHIGGLPHVLERYRIGAYVDPGVESKNAIDDEIWRILGDGGIPRMTARRGMRIDFGDGAVFDMLFPDKDVSASSDTNGSSIVGLLSYGAAGFMLTGDAGKAQERRVVELAGIDLKSQVLKAGHHGSRTSSDEAFVRAVAPEYAVVSAGKDNRYGHPNAEPLATFAAQGIKVLRTDELGTVSFESDGATVFLKEK